MWYNNDDSCAGGMEMKEHEEKEYKVMLSEKMALNVGYMWTNYHDYTKKSENYCGTNLPGTNVYSRTNKVFGLSLDYAF